MAAAAPIPVVATACIRASDLIPRPDKGPNAFNVTSRQVPGQVLAVNPNGTFTSTDDADGQYAVCYRVGDDLFWDCAGSGGNFYPTGCYGARVAVL